MLYREIIAVCSQIHTVFTVSTIPPRPTLPCQYHSTNTPLSPVSTIAPTPHTPLSVPFHQHPTLPCPHYFGNRVALDTTVLLLFALAVQILTDILTPVCTDGSFFSPVACEVCPSVSPLCLHIHMSDCTATLGASQTAMAT
jgi:hypothetical protein